MRLATETVSGCLENDAWHPGFRGTEAAQKIAMTENTPSAKPASPSPFIYVVPLLIVLAVGAMFWAGNDEREADAEEASKKVLEGKEYYVLVTLMEVHPAKQGGAGWDAGSSAPDMYYHLNRLGKTV